MNIEKAINRLQWRFKNENVKINESKITINTQDVDAIDFLINWVNNQKKESLKENLLFAKIYAYALSNEIEFYKDIQFSNRKLQEELRKPIEIHYNKIAEDLNRLELNKFLKSKGIITDHLENMLLKQNQQEAQYLLIKENKKEIEKYVLGVFDVKNVYKSLNNTITECLNKYKNTN